MIAAGLRNPQLVGLVRRGLGPPLAPGLTMVLRISDALILTLGSSGRAPRAWMALTAASHLGMPATLHVEPA